MTATAWREQNEEIFDQTVLAAAERFDVQPLAVEKDYWVCQALRAIQEYAPGDVIFKGGTSLEKLRLIERFSEDLDLLVIGRYATARTTERAFKAMCGAAQAALPGCEQEKVNSGGKPGSMHRSVRLNLPLVATPTGSAIADPEAILVELGQSGGRHPAESHAITSLLGRALSDAGVPVDDFSDLGQFEVLILHPGRTLIEKLLRVNNFASDPILRDGKDGWPRIGRQFYDVYALLGDDRVRAFLEDRTLASEVVADCMRVSLDFKPDASPPPGGFSACPAFDSGWEHAALLRDEHEKAMAGLYYGAGTPPTFDMVLTRIGEAHTLLQLAP